MTRARITSLHCDVAGCDSVLAIRDRPTIKLTARRAGWVTWTRAGHPLDVCPGCDARLLSGITADVAALHERTEAVA